MSSERSATYLSTRVAILRARLLPDDQLQMLIEQPLEEGLAERFGSALLDPELDTASIERTLIRALLEDLAVIMRPLSGDARNFFTFWARRFELFNLKALIRGKLRNLPESAIERNLQEMPSFTVLDHESLLRTESVAELLRQIEAGPYGDIARQARQVLEERQDTLAVEAAIDQRYYAGLMQRVLRLPRHDRQPLYALMGSQVDKLNLTWLVRYRFAYHLSPTETYYYLIQHGAQLSRDTLLQLVELEQCDEVMEALPPALAKRLVNARNPLDVERRMEDLVRERATTAARFSHSVITRAFAYLLLRECELNRLRSIVHGKRLGLSTEFIRAVAADGAEIEGLH
jgi:V/A-type H+-transporting ATPase subunit C